MTKTKATGKGPETKKIMIITQDPVARELMQRKYRKQIKPSKKVYDRKKERQAARRIAPE